MSPLEIGSLIALSTIIILATGIPVAFGLIFIAISFLLFFEGFSFVTSEAAGSILGTIHFGALLGAVGPLGVACSGPF